MTACNTHVIPQSLENDPHYEQDPNQIHGRVVRVHDFQGRATAFVGVITRMRRSAFGVQCDVGGGGRRLVVPLCLLSQATVDEMPQYTNVHKPELGKHPLAIDGSESEL